MKLTWTLALLATPLAWAADAPPAQPIPISLKRAIEIATSPEGNAAIQIAGEALKQAHDRSLESRAALLPDFEGQVYGQSRTENLAALGLHIVVPIPGFSIPNFVGPFTTFDARASVTQSVFDFSSIKRYQASKLGVDAAKSDTQATAEQIAAQTARAYVAALKAANRPGRRAGQHHPLRSPPQTGQHRKGSGHRHRHRNHPRPRPAR